MRSRQDEKLDINIDDDIVSQSLGVRKTMMRNKKLILSMLMTLLVSHLACEGRDEEQEIDIVNVYHDV